MKKYEMVIFDWDGTLMDSTGRIVTSMQLAAADAGVEPLDSYAIKQIIGLGLYQAIEVLYPKLRGEMIEAVRQYYSQHYVELDKEPCGLFPNVNETLLMLQAQNIQMAVATGKSRKGLDRVMTASGLTEFFVGSRCADETQSKPHPAMVLELCDELRIDVDKTLVIGDTSFDMEMAEKAGADRIAVTYGAHDEEKLLPYTPVMMTTDIAEILKLFN